MNIIGVCRNGDLYNKLVQKINTYEYDAFRNTMKGMDAVLLLRLSIRSLPACRSIGRGSVPMEKVFMMKPALNSQSGYWWLVQSPSASA